MKNSFTWLLLLSLLLMTGCQDAAETTGTESEAEESAVFSESSQEKTPEISMDDSSVLAPGSKAAPISLTAVVHGAPFEDLQPGKVHVIEFWATWCGPCLRSMPHISSLQEQYQGQVQFVGVSDEDVDTVTEFLAMERGDEGTWADILRYTIAADEDRSTHRDYLGAAQQNGIPCAFIVNKEGMIAWIGHPAAIDEPLQAVVSGSWDIAQAREEFLASLEPTPSQEPEVEVDPLEIGFDAPPVQLASVVQGAGVEPFTEGKVYVVEFWATWCGPCLQSMPHISSLQEEYGDKVQFIGVTSEDAETVTEFMTQESHVGGTWAETLGYSIVLDDDSTTWDSYMTAAGQGGIPCAFIVEQNGKVAWIGHPMSIDDPLAAVVAGDFDLEASAANFRAEKQLQSALQTGDMESAIGLLDTLLESDAGDDRYNMMRLQILGLLGRQDELLTAAAAFAEQRKDDSQALHAVAWTLVQQDSAPAEALDLALTTATAANELAEGAEAPILNTLAQIYHAKGDLQQAVEWQRKVVAIEPEIEQIQETLKRYEAELQAASEAEPAEVESSASVEPATETEPDAKEETSEAE